MVSFAHVGRTILASPSVNSMSKSNGSSNVSAAGYSCYTAAAVNSIIEELLLEIIKIKLFS